MNNGEFDKNKEWELGRRKISKAHGFFDGNQDHKKNFENAEKAQRLALEILRLARNILLINMRFMEAAFVRIVPDHDLNTLGLATDGQFLYYNSVHVCRMYRKEKEIPARDLLHVTLHCLFRHLFIGKKIRPDLWDLACDIAVENIITELDFRSLRCERQTDQAWIIRKLKDEVPKFSAEWIYKYFNDQDISEEEAAKLREYFYADDHSIWYKAEADQNSEGDPNENDPGGGDEGNETEVSAIEGDSEADTEEDEGEDSDSDEDELAVTGGEEGGIGKGDPEKEGEGDKPALTPAELEEAWKEIAERIQVDLETSSDSWGEGTGNMQQALQEINREKYDYTSLLKRFSVLGESIEVNDDEFDYIFYTYGLKLYQNMPLVEPLEYKDVKKIREFVIAIDTSESVSGDVVQKFVEKTWNILKQSENYFSRVNIHIIQCGAKVEEDVKITTQDEFDDYLKNMVLKGFGGTDFRPVFTHVDQLLKQHEFTNLKGLIYFTDGYGAFPHDPPAYDAAFVFLDQGYELPEVPVWAIRMVLKEDEIREF